MALGADTFAVRGTIPWHNFLSGPSAWDEEDYERYLDRLKALDLNYVAFHCYTGGAERYAPYVEPLIRIRYRDVVPEATFDTSLTARWGYRPLRVSEFAFGTGSLFKLPPGVDAFGARCAVLARSKEEHYERAQALMRRVIEMAHQRGIQVGIGFEFGIHPPEFASIVPQDSRIPGTMLPDPTHPSSIEILRSTLDDLLAAYPGLDWVWLWLHEHTMFAGQAKEGGAFRELMARDRHFFRDARDEGDVFTGVWSLAYIREAHEYLARRAPKVRLVVSGWGGGTQLPGTLRGLDRALPKQIVISCLSPEQGWLPQPDVLAEIAKNRPTWAIPWLEGDARLWHLQHRANLLRDHVQLAERQNLQGVLAVHWRTEEIRTNIEMFASAAANPSAATTLEAFYLRDGQEQYGEPAAPRIAEILCAFDREQAMEANSMVFFPYDPKWGRITAKLRERLSAHVKEIRDLAASAKEDRHRANLQWLADNFEFTLLLDEVGRCIEPAYRLKEDWLTGRARAEDLQQRLAEARAAFDKAPIEPLFRTFARRVRSRGELGELSSLNQRVWLQYRELAGFLQNPR